MSAVHASLPFADVGDRPSGGPRGRSQHERAEHAGVTRPTVARIKVSFDVKTAKLMRIAVALALVLRVERQEGAWNE